MLEITPAGVEIAEEIRNLPLKRIDDDLFVSPTKTTPRVIIPKDGPPRVVISKPQKLKPMKNSAALILIFFYSMCNPFQGVSQFITWYWSVTDSDALNEYIRLR